jgi:transposase
MMPKTDKTGNAEADSFGAVGTAQIGEARSMPRKDCIARKGERPSDRSSKLADARRDLGVPKRVGRPSRLGEVRRRELLRALGVGAKAEGFATERWTLPRIACLIERRFGLSYSESHVWRILVSLGFSYQRPSGRELGRDKTTLPSWKRAD